jgi:hypothetical protein
VTGVKRGSFAADAEFSEGDVIVQVEGKDPKDLKSFSTLYEDLVAGKTTRMLFVTKRGSIYHYHVLKPSYQPASPRAGDATGDDFDESEEAPDNGPDPGGS